MFCLCYLLDVLWCFKSLSYFFSLFLCMVWGCVLASLIYMWLSNFSNCLLKKLSTHCIFFFLFKDLLSISVWVYFWVFMLLHWFIYLYFCQYQPILSTLSFVVGEGNGTPLQYSCLEIPWTEEPDRLQSMGSQRVGHYWATSFSLFTFTFHFHALEKDMATHSSILAWRNPGTGEPGELPSMGSHRVIHDWSDLAAAAAL